MKLLQHHRIQVVIHKRADALKPDGERCGLDGEPRIKKAQRMAPCGAASTTAPAAGP